jgi:cell division protein ZapA
MSNVTLTIGGRQYRVACADGQEDHIVRLGAAIDEKLSTMGDNAGPNEARALLFAALLLADEIYELKQQPAAPAPPPDTGPDPAPALEALAERLEKLAASLEGQRVSA